MGVKLRAEADSPSTRRGRIKWVGQYMAVMSMSTRLPIPHVECACFQREVWVSVN